MKAIVLTIAMFTVCGLFVVMRGGAAAPRATVPAVPAAQTGSPAAADPARCDPTMMSEDAASCSDGGWQATETCCFVSGRALERWTLGSSTKCCGACFL